VLDGDRVIAIFPDVENAEIYIEYLCRPSFGVLMTLTPKERQAVEELADIEVTKYSWTSMAECLNAKRIFFASWELAKLREPSVDDLSAAEVAFKSELENGRLSNNSYINMFARGILHERSKHMVEKGAARMVEEAVKAERERCAALVLDDCKNWPGNEYNFQTLPRSYHDILNPPTEAKGTKE
jgi:hypothetical protein